MGPGVNTLLWRPMGAGSANQISQGPRHEAAGQLSRGAEAVASPPNEGPALRVLHAAGGDQNDVDDPPDPQSAARNKLEDAGANLPQIEPIDASGADKDGEQQRHEPVVTGSRLHGDGPGAGGHATPRADHRLGSSAWPQTRQTDCGSEVSGVINLHLLSYAGA